MADIIVQLEHGFLNCLTPLNLAMLVLGIVIGLLIGVLPGLTLVMGVALALPFTYSMDVTASIVLLTAMYVSGTYGGAFTAILFRIPGEPIDVPMLWILAGQDTEAPHETTLANLQQLKKQGVPVEIIVFDHAEHGMIAVEPGPDGPRNLGRTVPGYFERLAGWIQDRDSATPHGSSDQAGSE